MKEQKHTVKTTCKFCREKFDSFGLKKICPDCEASMGHNFQRIKTYLDEFPDAALPKICEDLEVSISLVKLYLKEEQLETRKNSRGYVLKCNSCEKPIASGRYCADCELEILRSDLKRNARRK